MANEKRRLIDAEPIKKFIVDGLNNPDLTKAFGHDAIEILTEIEYAPTVDAVEVVHGRWEFGELEIMGQPVRCSICGWGADMVNKAMWLEYPGHKYCGNCGAKMDGERRSDG